MSEEVELVPVEYDQAGRPRRYEVVQVGTQQHIEYVDMGPSQLPEAATRGNMRTTAHIEGSYQDRARGFSISTNNLAMVTAAFVGAAVLVIGDDVTFAVLSAWVIGGYFIVWLGAFMLHTFVSAEGNDLIHTLLMWRYLNREQSERFRRYRGK